MTAKQSSVLLTVFLTVFVVAGTQIDLLPRLTWHDQQRLAQIGFLTALFLVVSTARNCTISLRLPILVTFAGIAAVGAFSAALSPIPYWAWIEWSLLVALLYAVLLLGDLRKQAGSSFDRLMLTLVCATCALFAIRFFATYSAAIAVGADLDTRELSSLGFSNRRFFGQLQTLTMPLLALPVLAARDSLRRTAAFVLLGSWWMLAFTSATRGTFFALAIAMPVAALWSSQLGARWFKLQVAGLAVGFALYVLLFLVLPQLVGVNVDIENRLNALFDSRGRIENWIYTMGIIGANPLLGVGPMHLAYWLNPETPVAHPHNSMLQIAAEWGIPAALLGAACVAYALRKYFQRFRGSNTTALSISIMATLVGTTFQSLVDGVIVMPVTQVFLVVMGGWALGLYLGLDLSRDQAERITIRKGLVTTSLAAILSVLIVTAFQDFGRLEARQEAYFADHGTYLHPRYWQQGWIGVPADPKPAP